MNNKERIIVDGVNVSKCFHLYIHPETGAKWCTHRRFGGCQVMPNCRFKEVARLKHELKAERIRNTRLQKRITKELIKQERYRKALEEIEEFCITYSDNHDAYVTVYKYILDIINKAKGEIKQQDKKQGRF